MLTFPTLPYNRRWGAPFTILRFGLLAFMLGRRIPFSGTFKKSIYRFSISIIFYSEWYIIAFKPSFLFKHFRL